MIPLPRHATVVADPTVWMETEAVEQLARVASLPGCVQAVGMPDLHPGRGIPIGAAFRFADRVLPDLVGGDAGCGVLMLVARRAGPRGDALERRVLAALETELLPEVSREELLHAAVTRGPRGLAEVEGVPGALAELALSLPAHASDGVGPGAWSPEPWFGEQLGSVGGGNHFAEISRIDEVVDPVRAEAAGLAAEAQTILVHTGSRALGAALAARWVGQTLEGARIDEYLAELAVAIRYARTNRLLCAWRLLQAAGLGGRDRIATRVDIVHNGVEPCAEHTYLHRKGAAPAERDQTTVVLGSRGAPSWILAGLGNPGVACCVAHGAGRRMGRSEARAKLKEKYVRSALVRTALGSRVICADPALLYEEHPSAYKPIEPVVASLERAGAAVRVASLVPLVTVKT